MSSPIEAATPGSRVPAAAFIRVPEQGAPWIEGFRCPDCGAVALERTMACRKCTSRAPQASFTAATQGRLYAWTVVRRSYPGIPVPFVSAIVDLDDGLTVKGTLRDVDPDAVKSGMRVELKFDDANGATDPQGCSYVGFHFIPAGESA